MKVLVVNAGSSSLKYQLFNTDTNKVDAKGICERIGIDGKIEHKTADNGDKYVRDIPMPNHSVATKILVEVLTDREIGCISDMSEIEAVGHRIVHGGDYFSESCIVDDSVIEKLELCKDIAPLHTIPHLMGIRGCIDVMPNIPQVLVFDTAFHQTMPEKAYMYPIPYTFYKKYKIRRYGFHGTSHRYVSGVMCKILGRTENTKIITCHIGNGSSITAVKDGKVIDTSMGFTPLDGVEMGTRCGAIDPSIVTHIMKYEKMSPDEMNEFMNKECGFLGVSGKYADSRDIEQAILEGDKQSLLAAEILSYQMQKYIGAYTAAMNGLDALVFTAGMGENNPLLRKRVCDNMDFFGIELDEEVNTTAHHQPNIIQLSTNKSKVAVYLIPTNEELVIATETENLIKKLK